LPVGIDLRQLRRDALGGLVSVEQLLDLIDKQQQTIQGVRTENVVGRPDSAAKAFVGARVVSPTGAGSLIAFRRGDKWEYGRRFFLPGADAPCARHGARLCHAPLPAYATRM
jgi:hypothetical protein